QHQRARQRHAALHAAGKLVRELVEIFVHKTETQRQLARAVMPLPARHAGGLKTQCNIVERRLPRQQARLLEHIGRFGETVFDRTLAHMQQTRAEIEQRGLAATRGADQRDDLPRLHAEVDVRQDFVTREGVRYTAHNELRRTHVAASRQRSTSRLIGSSSRYSTASNRPTTATIHAMVEAVSRCERDTASAAPTPSCVDSSSAITTTFQEMPSAAIHAGKR